MLFSSHSYLLSVIFTLTFLPIGVLFSEKYEVAPEVLFLGEHHDNAEQHRARSKFLYEEVRERPLRIVFEQVGFPISIDQRNFGAFRDFRKKLAWDQSWTHWEKYEPLLRIIHGEAEKVFGAGIHRDVFKSPEEKKEVKKLLAFFTKIELPKSESMLALDELVAAHCGMITRKQAVSMLEAQTLRDKMLAQKTLESIKNFKGLVVVIAGNGHVRKERGAPFYLREHSPTLHQRSIAWLEPLPPFDRAPIATDMFARKALPYDQVFFSRAPNDRSDPCAISHFQRKD